MYFFILFVWKNERWFLKNVIATDLRHIVVKNASQQRAWANRPCFFWHFFLRRIFKILICLAERLEMSLAIFLLFPLNWSLRHSIIWIKNRIFPILEELKASWDWVRKTRWEAQCSSFLWPSGTGAMCLVEETVRCKGDLAVCNQKQ